MVSKLLRDSAFRFLEAEKRAIAQWSAVTCSRYDCCPVKKADFKELIRAELQPVQKAA